MSKELKLDDWSEFIELNAKNKINVKNCFYVKLPLEKYYDPIHINSK